MEPVQGLNKAAFHYNPVSTRPNGSNGPDFKDTLEALARKTDAEIKEADRMAAEFAVGKRQGIHEVVIASEKAGISFKLLMEIRNKLLDAYQEIMRMSF